MITVPKQCMNQMGDLNTIKSFLYKLIYTQNDSACIFAYTDPLI